MILWLGCVVLLLVSGGSLMLEHSFTLKIDWRLVLSHTWQGSITRGNVTCLSTSAFTFTGVLSLQGFDFTICRHLIVFDKLPGDGVLYTDQASVRSNEDQSREWGIFLGRCQIGQIVTVLWELDFWGCFKCFLLHCQSFDSQTYYDVNLRIFKAVMEQREQSWELGKLRGHKTYCSY